MDAATSADADLGFDIYRCFSNELVHDQVPSRLGQGEDLLGPEQRPARVFRRVLDWPEHEPRPVFTFVRIVKSLVPEERDAKPAADALLAPRRIGNRAVLHTWE